MKKKTTTAVITTTKLMTTEVITTEKLETTEVDDELAKSNG